MHTAIRLRSSGLALKYQIKTPSHEALKFIDFMNGMATTKGIRSCKLAQPFGVQKEITLYQEGREHWQLQGKGHSRCLWWDNQTNHGGVGQVYCRGDHWWLESGSDCPLVKTVQFGEKYFERISKHYIGISSTWITGFASYTTIRAGTAFNFTTKNSMTGLRIGSSAAWRRYTSWPTLDQKIKQRVSSLLRPNETIRTFTISF